MHFKSRLSSVWLKSTHPNEGTNSRWREMKMTFVMTFVKKNEERTPQAGGDGLRAHRPASIH